MIFDKTLWVCAIVLIIDLIISIAASKMAYRKYRSDTFWGIISFIYTPSLLILWMLPDGSCDPMEKDQYAQLCQCTVCNAPVSSDSKKCPTCGAKNILFSHGESRAFEYIGIIFSILHFLGSIFWFFYIFLKILGNRI